MPPLDIKIFSSSHIVGLLVGWLVDWTIPLLVDHGPVAGEPEGGGVNIPADFNHLWKIHVTRGNWWKENPVGYKSVLIGWKSFLE